MNTIKCIELLKQAIVQVTVNTYVEQGQAGADEVFKLLEQVESEIKTGECGENQKTTEAPKKTNFDRITENVDVFIKWVLDTYNGVPAQMPCGTSCNKECGECFKEWLQKECEND